MKIQESMHLDQKMAIITVMQQVPSLFSSRKCFHRWVDSVRCSLATLELGGSSKRGGPGVVIVDWLLRDHFRALISRRKRASNRWWQGIVHRKAHLPNS